METMYDRLGDLLNETLENGAVKFVRIVRDPEADAGEDTPVRQTIHSAESLAEQERERRGVKDGAAPQPDSGPAQGARRAEKKKKSASYRRESPGSAARKQQRVTRLFPSAAGEVLPLRSLTPDEERAFRLLGITANASPDDVRRAYKEKLKYYHPDRYAGNPVLSKVANDKTREVVAAYALVCAWIEEGASRR